VHNRSSDLTRPLADERWGLPPIADWQMWSRAPPNAEFASRRAARATPPQRAVGLEGYHRAVAADPSFGRTWRYVAFDANETTVDETVLASDELAAPWVATLGNAERVTSVCRMEGAGAPKVVWIASS
jgi:hypothetical protein